MTCLLCIRYISGPEEGGFPLWGPDLLLNLVGLLFSCYC